MAVLLCKVDEATKEKMPQKKITWAIAMNEHAKTTKMMKRERKKIARRFYWVRMNGQTCDSDQAIGEKLPTDHLGHCNAMQCGSRTQAEASACEGILAVLTC